MKTKRHSRIMALLLVLCLCVTMLPGTVIAQEAEVPTTTEREVTRADVLAGIADFSDLYDPLDPNTVPDIIGYEEAMEKNHVKRSYEDEGDELNKVVFENLDATKTMYLFDFPVKYVDNSGEIQDISLEIADGSSGAFETAGNSTLTTFSAQASGGISLSGNGTEITLVPIMPTVSTDTQTMTAGSTAGNLGSISTEEMVISHAATRIDEKTIQYRYDSKTTIEYSLTYTGFKEDIVVSEYTGQTEYAFTLRTGGYALEEMDGSYFLVDDAGNIKATIGDIIIFTADERNNTMGGIVPTTIVENEEYLLTIMVDPGFLVDENTAYPIRIDPTVEINYDNNGAGAIQDATVYTDDTTNGSLGSIFVGLKQNGGIARILMKFPGLNLSSLGSTAIIESATVTLRDLLCESTALDVYCHVYAGATWDESNVCWDNTIAVSPTYLSTHLDTKTISYSIGTALSDQHRYSFDITDAVQGWKDGNYSQEKGIVFKAFYTVEDGSTYNWKTIGSYNRASYKPTLSVTYNPDNEDQFLQNTTYYINNKGTGKYLRYYSGSVSGQSGTLYALGKSIQWELQGVANGYVIRAKNDTTKYLAAHTNIASNAVEVVTVSQSAIPGRCVWRLVPGGAGYQLQSVYSLRFLYSSGSNMYTSASVPSSSSTNYLSYFWRAVTTSQYGNTSSHVIRELSGASFATLILNAGDSKAPSITKTPSNAVWADVTDFTFVYSSGTSGCTTVYSLNLFTAVKNGIATYTATHKVTGRQTTFKVYVDRYTYELTREYGFADDDALLIRSVYDKVDAAYPYYDDDLFRAWVYSRLLGGIVYGHDSFKWNDVAGQVFSGSEETYFTNTLGYSTVEYTQMKEAIEDNHSNTNTTDFAHMQISLSARLAYKCHLTGFVSNIGTFCSNEDVSYLAGWLGDATIVGDNGKTSFKNDDYCADLDAENIYRLIEQGYTMENAINTYYTSLTSSNTRADVFLGYINYSTVRTKINYEMIDKSLYMQMDIAASNGDLITYNNCLALLNDEQYHLDIIMSYPDTYNFMCSVRDGRSNIGNY